MRTRSSRLRGALAALVAALAITSALGSADGVGAQEAPGKTLAELCSTAGPIDISESGPRTCIGFESGSVLLASACGLLLLPAEVCASLTDGRVIDPSIVDDYQNTWVHRALRLQERLDRGEPMKNSLVPHSHNSANSTSYPPTVSNTDPNQRYTIGDQLRMDIRGIELDLHWAPSPSGTAATGGKAVVLCHGRTEAIGDLQVHLGCSADQPFRDGLREIRTFLDAAGNEDQVVLLYLENQLDGDPQAHDSAADDLEAVLGPDIERPPPGSTCEPAPMDSSRQDFLDRGHRVVLVGNCGPGQWGSFVFDRGPLWDESGHDGAYPNYPECIDTVRADQAYDANWIRHWEDLTFLSAAVEGDQYPITPDVTRSMVRCGVDMIGFDRLEPFDGRLQALVWSWAPDEPMLDAGLECAARGEDGRFRMQDCAGARGFACRTAAGAWTVPIEVGPWADGDATCEAAGAEFTVPPTGWENEQLGVAAAGADLWIPIGIADVGGSVAVAPVVPAASAAGASTSGGSLPATGGNASLTVALGLASAAVLLAQKSAATSRR